jgi:hypothetical protein
MQIVCEGKDICQCEVDFQSICPSLSYNFGQGLNPLTPCRLLSSSLTTRPNAPLTPFNEGKVTLAQLVVSWVSDQGKAIDMVFGAIHKPQPFFINPGSHHHCKIIYQSSSIKLSLTKLLVCTGQPAHIELSVAVFLAHIHHHIAHWQMLFVCQQPEILKTKVNW